MIFVNHGDQKLKVVWRHMKVPSGHGLLVRRPDGSQYTYNKLTHCSIYKVGDDGVTGINLSLGVLRCSTLEKTDNRQFAIKESLRRAIKAGAGTHLIEVPAKYRRKPLLIEKLDNDGKFPYELRKAIWNAFHGRKVKPPKPEDKNGPQQQTITELFNEQDPAGEAQIH